MGGGHGDGHGHHGPAYKIPDYKIYKVEDVPHLVTVRDALAKQGLKDPWLRNHVWKYGQPYKTPKYIFDRTIGRGMKWGFLAALITTGLGYVWPDDQWHGVEHEGKHGHGGDHGHGEAHR